jgi:site-specific DNA recombinase
MVLAQDRDRFAREPAYLYLLKQEFEHYGTRIRSLSDRDDDSPEGELTEDILDQLAKFERAKTAERTRRGRLRKAREGKVIAGRQADYGFRYNETRDGYVVYESEMVTVRRIFEMFGVEGSSVYGVKAALDTSNVPTPGKAVGKGVHWTRAYLRGCVFDDVYKPHTLEEVAALVSPQVAARLDPDRLYAIWWYNRRPVQRTRVLQDNPDGERRYVTRTRYADKPREEWIAVSVPNAGVPRVLVDRARAALKGNKKCSGAGRRFWELSGGIFRCAECERALVATTTLKGTKNYRRRMFYYQCATRRQVGKHACSFSRSINAKKAEAAVWEAVSTLLTNPERLRRDLEAMIDREKVTRGDPELEVKAWAATLSEVERKRDRYQEMFADDTMTLDELRSKLNSLEETRETARRELTALSSWNESLEAFERDKDKLLKSYATLAPEALAALDPDERRTVYSMLGICVEALPDKSLRVRGAFGEENLVWEKERTSRRFSSEANPSSKNNKTFGFTVILCESSPPDLAFRILGS